MFLNYLKTFSAKRILKKSSLNVNSEINDQKITSIGLIIDDTHPNIKDKLFLELASHNIDLNTIKVLSFKNRYNKREVPEEPFFTNQDVSWQGLIKKKEALQFINTPFDLLISYYEVKKGPLLLATHSSRAKFKIGFTSVNFDLNHLSIDTSVEFFKVFVDELVKYLKILKKL